MTSRHDPSFIPGQEILTERIAPIDSPWYKAAWIALAAVVIAVLCALAIYLFHRPSPYVQSVLSLTGDSAQGQVIFQQNCAVCHGFDANGLVGPNLHHVASRKSRIGLIHQVTSGKTPPMPQFQPTPEAMADLLKYLETL